MEAWHTEKEEITKEMKKEDRKKGMILVNGEYKGNGDKKNVGR